jgi:hypothetical protein
MGRSVGRLPDTEQGFFSCANKRGEIQPRMTRITRMKNLNGPPLPLKMRHRTAKTNVILVNGT